MSTIQDRMLPLVEDARVTDHELMPPLHLLTRQTWPGDDLAKRWLQNTGERWGLYRPSMAELVKRGFIKTKGETRHRGSVEITPAGKKWYDAQTWWE